jgi:hypothetical protein
LSWAIKIEASESHTAVSRRCAAKHTISNRGPAGRETKVVSVGSDVIDLKRSLRAFELKVVVLSLQAQVIGRGTKRTYMANLHIQRPQFHNTPNGSENVLSELHSSWIVSSNREGGSIRYYLWIFLENREAVI